MSKDNQFDDKNFDKQIESLYNEVSKEAPSLELDDKILSNARAAVRANQTKSNSNKFSWQKFSSIAASFMVVVTIGLIYRDNESSMAPESEILIQESYFSDAQSEEIADIDPSDLANPAQAAPQKEKLPVKKSAGGADWEKSAAKIESKAQAERVRSEQRKAYSKAKQVEQLKAKPKAKPKPRAMPKPMTVRIPNVYSDTDISSSQKVHQVESTADESVEFEELLSDELMRLAPSNEKSDIRAKNDLIQSIRNAINENDIEKAKRLWARLKDINPEEQLPEDLVRFFRKDFEGRDSQ